MAIGEKEEGYIDAYYGPPEWREAARANPRSVADLLLIPALAALVAGRRHIGDVRRNRIQPRPLRGDQAAQRDAHPFGAVVELVSDLVHGLVEHIRLHVC